MEHLVLEPLDYTFGEWPDTLDYRRCDFCDGSIIDTEWCRGSFNEADWPALYRLDTGEIVCSNCLERGVVEA